MSDQNADHTLAELQNARAEIDKLRRELEDGRVLIYELRERVSYLEEMVIDFGDTIEKLTEGQP